MSQQETLSLSPKFLRKLATGLHLGYTAVADQAGHRAECPRDRLLPRWDCHTRHAILQELAELASSHQDCR